MRTIESHKVNPTNDTLTISVADEPGAGGACHDYIVTGFEKGPLEGQPVRILFQNGPIPEAGVNGVTHEVLLAIVRDRLEAFQAGPFACDDNAVALTAVDNAIAALHARTKTRMARGVEGTHTV